MAMKEQRADARRLIAQCALKMGQMEAELRRAERVRREELAALGRQLIQLEGALRAEKGRLASAAAEKDDRIRALEAQVAALSLSRGGPAAPPTPVSSLESSPERPPRFVIRPLLAKDGNDSDRDAFGLESLVLPPPLPPPPRCSRRLSTSASFAKKKRTKIAPLRGHLPNEAFSVSSPMCTPEERLMLTADIGRERLFDDEEAEDASSLATTADEGFVSSQESATAATSHNDSSGSDDSAHSRLSDPSREKRHNALNHFLERHGLATKSLVSPVPACGGQHRKAADVIKRGGAAYAALFGKRGGAKSLSAPRLATLEEHEIALA